ncbi:unnamed protein product [Cylicocyclus nassatus]|uniref:Fibronectin type-III domain-containing protein n=1 Tax=Cylicocyclus nassatus TaxID=53992 RepID=A0AA36GNL4_CYLNA|nr:unnamed protein product [Cylicocyclus nassatus]
MLSQTISDEESTLPVISSCFQDLNHTAINYVRAVCSSLKAKAESSWIRFTTPSRTRNEIPQEIVNYENGIEGKFSVKGNTLKWSFSYRNMRSFARRFVASIDVYKYEKLHSEKIFVADLMATLQTESQFVIEDIPDPQPDPICRYYAINVTFKDGTYSFWSSNITCYEYPVQIPVPPTNVRVKFEHSSAITVSFKSHVGKWISHQENGCEVHLCKSANLASKCLSKQLSIDETSTMFEQLKHNARYYLTTFCYSLMGRSAHSPWIVIETPKRPRLNLPKKLDLSGRGIDVYVHVEEGSSWRLTWNFAFENQTTFPRSYLKRIDLQVFNEPYDIEDPFMVARKVSKDGIVIGTSPAYTLDTDCYIYNLDVEFADGTSLIYTTDEDCYDKTAPVYVLVFTVVVILWVQVMVILIVFIQKTFVKLGQ